MPSTGSDDKSYLTVREYAESRRLNPVTVYRLVADGRLEAERFGRAIRIPAKAAPTASDS